MKITKYSVVNRGYIKINVPVILVVVVLVLNSTEWIYYKKVIQ
jgi:hypothetical protein